MPAIETDKEQTQRFRFRCVHCGAVLVGRTYPSLVGRAYLKCTRILVKK